MTGGIPGVLPSQQLRAAVAAGEISAASGIVDDQVQPASLDLRLADHAYRVRASFLPGRRRAVREILDNMAMHRIDLAKGAVLEQGCVYIVPLEEQLALPDHVSGTANPKSSTGRLDIFARVISDHGEAFDRIRPGYKGPLYAEVSPRSFSVLVRPGQRLVQLRLKRGGMAVAGDELAEMHRRVPLVNATAEEAILRDGIAFTVALTPVGPNGMVGYRARRHSGMIDLDRIAHYDPAEFWDPLSARGDETLILDPDAFYILASREHVTVPVDHAAEMQAYDTEMGEFRVHYAGFFDPGFGDPSVGGAGSRAVLEVRSHEVPFRLEDGQIVGRLVYEPLADRPDRVLWRGHRLLLPAAGAEAGKAVPLIQSGVRK